MFRIMLCNRIEQTLFILINTRTIYNLNQFNFLTIISSGKDFHVNNISYLQTFYA